MGDVLTTEMNTRAAWRTQIPVAAWALMMIIAVCCNLLIGYCAGRTKHGALLFVLPFVISVSFALIGEIDVPGRGVIRVSSVDLEQITVIPHATNTRN